MLKNVRIKELFDMQEGPPEIALHAILSLFTDLLFRGHFGLCDRMLLRVVQLGWPPAHRLAILHATMGYRKVLENRTLLFD